MKAREREREGERGRYKGRKGGRERGREGKREGKEEREGEGGRNEEREGGKERGLAGALRMTSKQVTINAQGKLTVPKDWADKIGLKAEGPVKLAGRDSYFVICTEDSFTRISEADLNMDDGGLGVL